MRTLMMVLMIFDDETDGESDEEQMTTVYKGNMRR